MMEPGQARVPPAQPHQAWSHDTNGEPSSQVPSWCEADDAEKIEAWLDEHQEFVEQFFTRKATCSMVDQWLVARARAGGDTAQLAIQSEQYSSTDTTPKSTGANTPVRKVSAQELDKGGTLRPLLTTVDGMSTFISPSASSQTSRTRFSRHELQLLDERELIFELVKDICHDLDVISIGHKILRNVSILTKADRCSLFLVDGVKGTEDCQLISHLFDVSSNSTLEEALNGNESIKVPWGTGIVGYVAKTGEPQNIANAYEDSRFNQEIDSRTGYHTRSLLCMPIKDPDGDVVGVAQVINKQGIANNEEPFNRADEKVFASYLQFCGIGIKNAQLYERSQLECKRNQVLLDLARVIFSETTCIDAVVQKVMMHTQSLLQCERCQVLIVDEAFKTTCTNKYVELFQAGVFSLVFELQASDMPNVEREAKNGKDSRFPINIGITGYVATTGETLNIPDAYKDPRFNPAVDEGKNFRTRSILCMPIRNSLGAIIGVSQLVNKLDGSHFNKNDTNLFEAFSIFCGMGIFNAHMYEKAVKAMARQRVALEVLSYHAIAPAEEARRIKRLPVPSVQSYRLYDFTFSDFTLSNDDTLKACIRMFMDLDLVERYHINYEVLCRWLLSVKKNYRDVTYHNWRHAFNVAQTMFAMLKTGRMAGFISDIECMALLVAGLCHDLDHRGTNNTFQIKTASPLAQLYSTSTMEHHHFDQCIMILSSKGTEIFARVTAEEYEHLIKTLENAILATDLAVYFRKRGAFLSLVNSGYDWKDEESKDLLRAMMMTACDVAAITKPWEIQRKVAELVASEFFEQGDIEKNQLNIIPIDMMNRDKKDQLPQMQMSFIDAICLPVYEGLAKVSSQLTPLLEGVQKNRQNWQEASASVSGGVTDDPEKPSS